MSSWVRLWLDMPTDPKWRVIAKRAGRSIAEVLAVFNFMLANAGANATERGVLKNWSDEDVAAALDIDEAEVYAIRTAMQGKTLDGEKISGWENRQPKREDNSSDRAREWRQAQKDKTDTERNRTQPNAVKRPDADADADADADTEQKELEVDAKKASPRQPPEKKIPLRGTRLSREWDLPDDWGEWAEQQGMTRESIIRECDKFKDYWISKIGSNATKADWEATWRNWIRKHLEEYAK